MEVYQLENNKLKIIEEEKTIGEKEKRVQSLYEFTSSGILCTNHINCRDQLCVNLDTGELIP